tara:strand:+ start:850 stop:1086 length:237 start_codon:yes stop_codon:yes gene_type:complete
MMLALGTFIAVVGYVLVSAAMATIVINDFQLDTYVTLKTGVAAVLFVVFTVWPPIIVFCGPGKTDKNQIILDDDDRSW